ncbi:MAG: glycoside hydrolase family 97 protein [Salinivirgaceae bacterium]|jgi:alpha-glucosidase|nr:glycoside hydrolase family 97 protein [Salinivirgaceae bacterium]
MNRIALMLIMVLGMGACSSPKSESSAKVLSPDKNISVNVWLKNGKPYYSASYKGQEVIKPSALGLVLSNNDTLSANLKIANEVYTAVDDTWEQPWGAQKIVENNYDQYAVNLIEETGKKREIRLEFRVFNDGIGFRYMVPKQANLKEFVIMDELTEFNMTDNHEGWWIPAYKDNRYEYLFKKSPLSSLDTVHTPFTMEAKDGLHISIHEAALTKYAAMTIAALDNNKLKCDLAPWSDGSKVKTAAPMQSPWRTIQISPDAAGLITSNLILNLNEPNKLEDLSWVKPTKYLGIWWGMHIGKYTFWEDPKHGASTKHSIEHIDYSKKLGIDHLLIEGWNIGWTPAWYENLLHVFSFTESTSDFDFKKVTDYATENNVNIIGYHETGANIDNYLGQIDAGMQMYKDAGMHSIKIGQVGSRLMMKEWHYGQYGVEYYDFVLAKAAEYKLTVNFHEPIKQTGKHRTYPHWFSAEGARGQEYNAWSEGNPPEHTVILPFTRMLGGSMDFTPGIFSIKPTRVHTTLAKQLALYLTFYSPLQMLADLPENYDGHPAFKFMQDVPVNWETTKVLNAKIGDYYTVVRKDIDSNDWYLGSITDENELQLMVNLDFLEPGKKYRAEIYADAADAEFDKNPEAYKILEKEVDSTMDLTIQLAKGGGQAIRFVAL